jgi:hypothetical protein
MYAADSWGSSEAARAQGDCNTELILYTKMTLGMRKRYGSNGGPIGNPQGEGLYRLLKKSRIRFAWEPLNLLINE